MESLAGKTLGRYRIEKELGRGGMATVWLADDSKHGRKVAVKVMHPETAAAIGQDRFLREIEIAARLNHPHILPLFDSGADDGLLYYVMPHVAGESLRARLDREKQLPVDEALRLTREIASALGHAHQRGLVHRDVKPENVLLAEGIALVADFGIARAISPEPASEADTTAMATTVGAILGTPRYMAPEQVSGGEVDGRTDLYALACLLYEMLAGQPPFTAQTVEALMRMHLAVAPRPVTELRSTVPAALSAAIVRGLAKLPADRYATLAQFVEALVASSGAGTPTPTPESQRSATPRNLPAQRTRFIGRDRELAECARLMGDARILTLTGVGGSGKTRLALRLAESLLETHPDGVWFVDLAPLEAGNLIAQEVAGIVGAKEEPGRSIEDAVMEALGGRRVLLVLDNCEHLIRPCGDFCDRLLAALPDVRFVVTSREGLGIEGERLFAVRSLSLPGETGRDPETILKSEAVRLFDSRARDTDPEFALDASRAPVVAEICRRLDGIPLAIELAAARVRALTVEQILHMLDDRFRLLTGGSRNVLERHRTLRATVQWSYDHLEPEEQELFVTLSAFAGGWTLQAAAALADADEFDVLDRLTRLIDKSLVIPERHSGQEARYRMLETLRQFGQELLATSGRADVLRARHLAHFRGWVDTMREQLLQPFPVVEVGRLQGDVDNLRAALTWGLQHDVQGAAGLALQLTRLWFTPGHYAEGRRWLGSLLETGDALEPVVRANLLFRSGRLAFQQGDYDEALLRYREELQIRRDLGDMNRTARALARIGSIQTYRGDYAAAAKAVEEARGIYNELDDADGLGRLESSMGLDAYLQGDLAAARRLFGDSLAKFQRLGNPDRIQVALGNLAIVDLAEGDARAARGRLRECFTLNRKLENLYGITHDLPTLAEAYRLEGDPANAARLVGLADAMLHRTDAALEALERQLYDRVVAALREAMGDDAFEAARDEGRGWDWEQAVALAE